MIAISSTQIINLKNLIMSMINKILNKYIKTYNLPYLCNITQWWVFENQPLSITNGYSPKIKQVN